MQRTSLLLFALLLLPGCGRKSEPDEYYSRMLAQRTAEVESAREGKDFWQSTATVLGALAVLTLIIGAGLGSKAKDDANEE